MMPTALLAAAALMVDAALGEPRRWHPLVGFGRLASEIEAWLHPGEGTSVSATRRRGVAALVMAVAPLTLACVLLLQMLSASPWLAGALQVAVLYFCIGHRSLREHAQAVYAALSAGDLAAARQRVGWMVSRQTADMDEQRVAAATVESVLENGSDAIFGALFWFAIAGAPGALAYRLCNTLDAMWGYRTPRHLHFGWAAARFDDLLNWVPARLTALSYAAVARSTLALRCWRDQAPAWDSPNGGPVMAAGAGALGLRLGGPAIYHGTIKLRPPLGEGREAQAGDIPRALQLVLMSVLLWLAVMAVLGVVLEPANA